MVGHKSGSPTLEALREKNPSKTMENRLDVVNLVSGFWPQFWLARDSSANFLQFVAKRASLSCFQDSGGQFCKARRATFVDYHGKRFGRKLKKFPPFFQNSSEVCKQRRCNFAPTTLLKLCSTSPHPGSLLITVSFN